MDATSPRAPAAEPLELEARAEALVDELRAEPSAIRRPRDLALRAGLRPPELEALLLGTFQAGAAELLERARVDRAARALLASRRPGAEIATEVGFVDEASLDRAFARRRRTSPRAYRRLAYGSPFEVALPSWLGRARLLRYHGRDPESVVEKVAQTAGGGRLAFAVRLAGRAALLRVELGARAARCEVEAATILPAEAMAEAHDMVLRLLGLTIDPRPFERRAHGDPHLSGLIARLVAGRSGLTPPQTPDPFSGLVWVVAGQQVSLPVAFSLRRRLALAQGEKVAEGLWAGPPAGRVAALEPADLGRLGFSRRKSEYLVDIARKIVAGELDLEALGRSSATRLERELLALRGLGPWSVNYLRLRAYALVDCVPVGDAALGRSLAEFFDLEARPDAAQTLELLRPFAPHRSLATFHFWQRLVPEP